LPWDEAGALTYWSRALLGAGRQTEATAKLDAARDIYRRLGAGEPWFDRLSAVRSQAIPPRHVSPTFPDGLTPREAEVLALLAAGLSNREIAETLVVSVRTVGRHVDNIYGKIGAHERSKARQYAREHGLILHESATATIEEDR
jgi:DNA-binding NarL/FixJ family response regulator